MKKVTVKELSDKILQLEPNEELRFYDSADKCDPPVGIIRVDVLESVIILINWIGGGIPCAIDITTYMVGLTSFVTELLDYISDEQLLDKSAVDPENVCVYLVQDENIA